ncbi:O-antigen ligase family protein [Caulobacter sp. DWP3-1-3b2]|uniref:O-antigen ligase family protein n=1 Tax=Caulobacter sp. DWP3-1-3b2 TaxID=2804643 RepID=UPI003CE6E8EF
MIKSTKIGVQRVNGAWAAVAAALIVSALHFGMGANNLGLSLLAAALEAGFLAVLVWRDWAIAALRERAAIVICFTSLFGLLVVVAVVPLLVDSGPVWFRGLFPGAQASIDRQATFVEILKLLALGCLFVAGLAIGSSLRRCRIMLTWLIYLAAGLAIFGYAIAAVWPDRTLSLQGIANHGRFTATFVSANTAGTLFGCMAMLVGGFLLPRGARTSRRTLLDRRPVATAFLLLFILGLMTTASRMAVAVSFPVAAAVLLVRGKRLGGAAARLNPVVVGCGAMFALLTLLAVFGSGLIARLPDLANDLGYRLRLMQVHYAFFLERPWFGWGMGSFHTLNNRATGAADFKLLYDVGAAHNVYIQWLSQAGSLGAGLMAAIFLLALVLVARGAAKRGEAGNHLAAILAVGLFFALQGLSDYALEVPSMSAMLALLLGSGVGLATRTSLENDTVVPLRGRPLPA